MKTFVFIFLFLFLIFISGCAYIPEPVQEAPKACTIDDDCICGGIDTATDNCFVGNKKYAEKYVDFSRDCPDFCTGIAAHLETRCVENECKIVRKQQPQPVACTEEAKLCPDGSAVGRVGPNCEFAPCPGDCTCPAGYRKDGDACNPECYYSKPPCLAPSVHCEK